MLTPALIMRGDNQVTVIDLDRTKHGTKRQVPLGEMRADVGKVKATGRAKQGNEHYNKEYDAWLRPLVDTVERAHHASIGDLAKRRHLARSRANEANARDVVEREFVRSLEAKELDVAVLRIHGNRMTKRRYERDRNLRCKESNAEQGARRALMTEKAKNKSRMGHIDTWSFGEGGMYSANFEAAVGCTQEEYAVAVDSKTLFALKGDEEAYAAKKQEVCELRASKIKLCTGVVLRALGNVAMGEGTGVPALCERLGGSAGFSQRLSSPPPACPATPAPVEPLEVNLSEVARRIDGPLVPGTTAVRPNASQCIKDLLRLHAADLLSVETLHSPEDRGVHAARRAHARVRVGNRLVRVPQAPTMKKVNAVFQEAWVKTGLVQLGRPIVRWQTQWTPNGDGDLVVTEKDQSGRLLPKEESVPAIVEQLRADDVLSSMPDFKKMPMEEVAKHLQRAKLPAEIKGEGEGGKRLRARAGLLHRRSARTQPKPPECNHCHCSLRCPCCKRWASLCQCASPVAPAPGCRECARAGRAAPAEVRADLAVRGVTLATHSPAGPDQQARALAHLIELEADDDAREDLVSIDEPACASEEETPEDRERRLAVWQNRLMMWLWIDDSPIAKKTLMLHLWGWLFHPLKMRWSREVGQMCQRCAGLGLGRTLVRGRGAHRYVARVDSSAPPICKGGRSHPGGSGWAGAATAPPASLTPQPHLHHRPKMSAIMNVSATVEDTRFVNLAYMLDLHTLENGITLRDGTHIDLDMRLDKADGQQVAKDCATSSGAAHNSCTCKACIQMHADLMACFRCEQRTLAALVRTARVCAEVPGFETRIDLRGSKKASLVALVRKLERAAAAAKATRGALKSALWFEAGDWEGETGLFMHELAAALGDGKGAGTAALYIGLVNCRQLNGRLPQVVQLMVRLLNHAAIAKYTAWGFKQILQVGTHAEATWQLDGLPVPEPMYVPRKRLEMIMQADGRLLFDKLQACPRGMRTGRLLGAWSHRTKIGWPHTVGGPASGGERT